MSSRSTASLGAPCWACKDITNFEVLTGGNCVGLAQVLGASWPVLSRNSAMFDRLNWNLEENNLSVHKVFHCFYVLENIMIANYSFSPQNILNFSPSWLDALKKYSVLTVCPQFLRVHLLLSPPLLGFCQVQRFRFSITYSFLNI